MRLGRFNDWLEKHPQTYNTIIPYIHHKKENTNTQLTGWLMALAVFIFFIFSPGIHTSNRELKEMMCSNKDPVEKKRRIYEEQLLPKHPPVFQEWFRRVFSDPYGWYCMDSAAYHEYSTQIFEQYISS